MYNKYVIDNKYFPKSIILFIKFILLTLIYSLYFLTYLINYIFINIYLNPKKCTII